MTTLHKETTQTFALGGDLMINRLGYGAMRITGTGIWGEPKDRGEAIKVLRRAVELGINFIDTADSYGPEVSENLIAEALYPYPKDLVIATKGGLTRSGPNKWEPLARPEYLRINTNSEPCSAVLRNPVTGVEQIVTVFQDTGNARTAGIMYIVGSETDAALTSAQTADPGARG